MDPSDTFIEGNAIQIVLNHIMRLIEQHPKLQEKYDLPLRPRASLSYKLVEDEDGQLTFELWWTVAVGAW
jgi:hypothetical protein